VFLFGAHGIDPGSVNLLSSVILAFGIGIQNIPEGFAISMPLRSEGFSKNKSFMFGQFSGFVEPVFAVIGALLVELMQTLLPYALGFAAGAMIFVTVEELIPESQRNGHSDFATAGLIIGFTIMMILDVALNSLKLIFKNIRRHIMKIGFIGLGNLGKAMVKRLTSEGIDITVWNRTIEKAKDLGCKIASSPAELISKVDVVFLNL